MKGLDQDNALTTLDLEGFPRNHPERLLAHPKWKATTEERDPRGKCPELASLPLPRPPTLLAPEIPLR
jgi:hypothetical protein